MIFQEEEDVGKDFIWVGEKGKRKEREREALAKSGLWVGLFCQSLLRERYVVYI